MPSKIRCEVKLREPQTEREISIIGKIGISQLFDRSNSWISVEATVQQQKSWKTVESLIYKPDIEKITFLSPECYISVSKEDLGLYSSVFSEHLKD